MQWYIELASRMIAAHLENLNNKFSFESNKVVLEETDNALSSYDFFGDNNRRGELPQEQAIYTFYYLKKYLESIQEDINSIDIQKMVIGCFIIARKIIEDHAVWMEDFEFKDFLRTKNDNNEYIFIDNAYVRDAENACLKAINFKGYMSSDELYEFLEYISQFEEAENIHPSLKPNHKPSGDLIHTTSHSFTSNDKTYRISKNISFIMALQKRIANSKQPYFSLINALMTYPPELFKQLTEKETLIFELIIACAKLSEEEKKINLINGQLKYLKNEPFNDDELGELAINKIYITEELCGDYLRVIDKTDLKDSKDSAQKDFIITFDSDQSMRLFKAKDFNSEPQGEPISDSPQECLSAMKLFG